MSNADIRNALFSAAGEAMAQHGVEGLSLRSLTASVGKSTSLVFQQFGGKDGLLRETMGAMFERDRDFHNRFFGSLAGLELSEGLLSEVIQEYIRQRSSDITARAWLEAVYKSHQFPDIKPLVREWHLCRSGFWARLLEHTSFAALGSALPSYLVAEEAFASALLGRMDYTLLLRETVEAIIRGCAGKHDPASRRGPVGRWLEQRGDITAVVSSVDVPPSMEALMQAAVEQIILSGVTGLNLKRIASEIKQAPSQIVYYFGDFATFRRMAIWRALMHALPVYLNKNQPQNRADTDWAKELARTTRIPSAENLAGFYVTYSRALGQTCLLASSDPTLEDFVLNLRLLEGDGIYNASQHNWDLQARLGRDTATSFALWIKGSAILNEAAGLEGCDAELIRATAHILSGKPPHSEASSS